MREIQLTNGMITLVDDEDYERLAVFRWSAVEGRRGDFYAVRMARDLGSGGRKQSRCRQMQRDVLDPAMAVPGSIKSDHRDHNTLNNQRHNLRWLDARGSMLNRRLFENNTSGFRGVYWKSEQGKFRAQLMSGGTRYEGGHYPTAEEAARAYNRLALLHHREDARLNIIPEDVS